jgi:hypothetical protein
LGTLLEFELPHVFLNHIGHGHAQGGRKILGTHQLLPWLLPKQDFQTVCQALRIAGRIEVNGNFFALRHLAKVRKIRANNGHTKGACKMRNAAAAGGRRVRHHGDAGSLE